MTCYSPLHAFKAVGEDRSKLKVVFRRPDSFRGERLDLPCGQCIGCRLEKSRQWAVRCMHEASLYDSNCFVTLTYDDDHLPRGSGNCGRCQDSHLIANSICTADFQDFMKRLRKAIEPKKVRFYHCGEYGEQFGRPHYHALLFGHDFSDRKFFSQRGENAVFTSATLSGLWPFGFSVVGDVTFDSAAYVARYVMKKVTGERKESHYQGRKPEYTTMSRRPGIGARWYEKFKTDVYPRDGVVIRGHTSRAPRFYDSLLGREDPALLAQLKIQREKDGQRFVEDVLSDGRRIKVSDSDGVRLLVREEVKKAEITALKRPLEEVI